MAKIGVQAQTLVQAAHQANTGMDKVALHVPQIPSFPQLKPNVFAIRRTQAGMQFQTVACPVKLKFMIKCNKNADHALLDR